MPFRPSSQSDKNDKDLQFQHTDNQDITQHGNQHQQQKHEQCSDIQLQHQLNERAQRHQDEYRRHQREHERRIGDRGDENGVESLPTLLTLPQETLTSITAYLSPPALLSLGQVNKDLSHHVRDDHTWRVAFLCTWIGVGPNADSEHSLNAKSKKGVLEYDRHSWKTLLLGRGKKEDKTWREEYIWRYVMINRWSLSTNPTTTYMPVHSMISGMHLVSMGVAATPQLQTHSLVSNIENLPGSASISESAAGSGVLASVDSNTEGTTTGSNDVNSNVETSCPAKSKPKSIDTAISALNTRSRLRPITNNNGTNPAPTIPNSVLLLTSSIQYGIISRSVPVLGRVGTGYLDAIGSARGGRGGAGGWPADARWLANGNPNMQFRPDIIACDTLVDRNIASSNGGNPNVVVHPHIYVIWGTRTGEVVLTVAPHALDGFGNAGGGATGVRNMGMSSRVGGTVIKRSGLMEGHEGPVADVKWIVGSMTSKYALSAGQDGRLKLWNVCCVDDREDGRIQFRCVWTSTIKEREVRLPARGLGAAPLLNNVDECVRVEGLLFEHETTTLKVVCVMKTGDTRVWSLELSSAADADVEILDIKETVVPRPQAGVGNPDDFLENRPIALKIDPLYGLSVGTNSNELEDKDEINRYRQNQVGFLLAYLDDPVFFRVTVSFPYSSEGNTAIEVTAFGSPAFGPTNVVVPYFGEPDSKNEKHGLVFVGDRMGCVSVYHWEAGNPYHAAARSMDTDRGVKGKERGAISGANDGIISPLKTFEAHRDSTAVTALCWDGVILVTGSARGTTHVWDALTFAHLRSFSAPIKKERPSPRERNVNAWDAERERERLVVRFLSINSDLGAIGTGSAGRGRGGLGDILVVGVGDVVLAWQAGRAGARSYRTPQRRSGKTSQQPSGTSRSGGIPRPSEIRRAVSETKAQLALEKKEKAKKEKREKSYKEGLDRMGLGGMSESEMVAYLMMVSAEEEEERKRSRLEEQFLQGEDEIHEEDEDDDDDEWENEFEEDSTWYSSGSSGSSAGSLGGSNSSSGRSRSGMSTPTRQTIGVPTISSTPSVSSSSIFGSLAAPVGSAIGNYWNISPSNSISPLNTDSEAHFPPMPGGTSGSPTLPLISGTSTTSKKGTSISDIDKPKGSAQAISVGGGVITTQYMTTTINPAGGSPQSSQGSASAWHTPLKGKLQAAASSSSPPSTTASISSVAGAGPGTVSDSSRSLKLSAPSVGRDYSYADGIDEDEALKFVLELSLAEARSRGENV